MMTKASYVPERRDIVWLDFEPKKGKEIGKRRPVFVLSSKIYNQKTGLLICCPISTSIRGALTEVVVKDLDKPLVVAASLVQTLSWQSRNVRFIARAKPKVLKEVLSKLLPFMGAQALFG